MPELDRLDRDILLQAARGHATAEIAEQLNLKPSTVRNRIARCYRLNAIRNRVELLRWMADQVGVDVILEGMHLEGGH